MSDSKANDGDRLLSELHKALGFDEQPSQETIEMIMTGYDIVNIDVAIAELVHDSDIHEAPVPVR